MAEQFDHLLKILLIGDAGVGKSCLLLRFTQDRFDDLSPTIGVDFKLKFVDVNGKRLKLTIWDTAGQERFRTLTSSYYRGAHAIIFAYDVTRRETFESLSNIWLNEVDEFSTIQSAIKMVVANKVDRDSEREVSRQEGATFARQHGCLFVETSAKFNTAVTQAFEELVIKAIETPALLNALTTAGSGGVSVTQQDKAKASGCC